jgi:hypothetical protein
MCGMTTCWNWKIASLSKFNGGQERNRRMGDRASRIRELLDGLTETDPVAAQRLAESLRADPWLAEYQRLIGPNPEANEQAGALAAELLATLSADNPLVAVERSVEELRARVAASELAGRVVDGYCRSVEAAKIAVSLRTLNINEHVRELLASWYSRRLPDCHHLPDDNGGWCFAPCRDFLRALEDVLNRQRT